MFPVQGFCIFFLILKEENQTYRRVDQDLRHSLEPELHEEVERGQGLFHSDEGDREVFLAELFEVVVEVFREGAVRAVQEEDKARVLAAVSCRRHVLRVFQQKLDRVFLCVPNERPLRLLLKQPGFGTYAQR